MERTRTITLLSASGLVGGRWCYAAIGAAGVLCPALAGCGGYGERVERSRQYLSYRDSLDARLAPLPWRNDSLQLRVPRAFELVDQKPPKTTADKRVPDLISSLDGRLAVWKAGLKSRDGGTKPAWLVVGSNRYLWTQGTATLEDSEQFGERFVAAVYAPTGAPPPRRDQWPAKDFPEQGRFVAAKTYRIVTVPLPGEVVGPGDYTAHIYLHTRDALQVAVVWFLPKETAAGDLTEQESIGFSLSTLAIHGATSPSGGR